LNYALFSTLKKDPQRLASTTLPRFTMADFSQYGGASAEWLAVEATLPSKTFDLTQDPATLKKVVNCGRNEVSAAAMKTLAPKVKVQDHSILTRDSVKIEARSYRPISAPTDEKLPVYLYFHGGGFLFGTLSSEDAACAQLAINIGIVVLNVNYRHTPEHVFPVAWNDSQDSFAWLHQNIAELGGDPEKVLVGGISAGGQLAASLVLEKNLGKALTEFPPIAGQILIIPALAHVDTYADAQMKEMKSPEVSSYVENEFAPILPKTTAQFFIGLLKTGKPSLKDTKLNPGNATSQEVKGMPPTVFGIAGLDPLRDEGLLYAKKLAEAGVPTDIRLFKGVPHGHRRFGKALKASQHWDDAVEQGILWALEKPKATGKFDVVVKE
jgi:acetyl esterase/lipase